MFAYLVVFALAITYTAINTFALFMVVEGIYQLLYGKFFILEGLRQK